MRVGTRRLVASSWAAEASTGFTAEAAGRRDDGWDEEMLMEEAKVVTGRKVRYAVVGVGWIAQAEFMPGVKHTGNSEMVALVTGHEEKAAKVGEKYGIEKIYSYEELDGLLASGEIDAVYLATPNFDHVEYAVKVLEAGVHLLLEKPMAVSVAECERMIAASEKSGAKLMVAYRLHFEPGTLKGIERVRNGEIGTVRFFNSSFSQQISGQNHRAKHGFWAGPVPDMGPYCINAVRNLFGSEPVEVFATGVCTDPERFVDVDGRPFEDTVAVTLKFEAARVAAFCLSYNGGDVDDYRIVGNKGDLFSDPAYQVGVQIEHKLTVAKAKSSESFKKTDHFGGELKYFSDCILSGKDPEPDGEEGMLDVRVLEAIERALQTGAVQKLTPYTRSKRPDVEQKETLGAVKEPELVGAHKPSDGQ
jgi:predicted dehydrogenase